MPYHSQKDLFLHSRGQRLQTLRLYLINHLPTRSLTDINAKMEKLPAVYRVPTELWHEIFSHILKTWLLPGSGDNVYDNIFLFSHGYKSRAEYSRFESDRRKLGAVCRHWKAVADDFALNMVFTNFGKSAPISKERFDLSQRIEVANGCLCSQHPFKLCVIPPIQHGRDGVTAYKPVLDSPFSLEHVQVISSGAPTCFGRFIDAKYINSAPKLRALGVQVDSLKGVTSLDSLTHLSIGDTSGREALGTISLPCLRCLYLHLTSDRVYEATPWKAFDRWIFPKITFICVSGVVSRGTQHKGLRRFICNHASTLENLILIHSVKWPPNSLFADHTINFRDLQQYRRLKVLGLTTIYGLNAVGGINEPSTVDISLPPLSLLLSDIGNLPGCPDAQKIAEQYLSLATHPTAIFDKIVMTNSWSEVIQEWETCVENGMRWTSRSWREISPLDRPREFFRAVSKTNNVFVDKDGIDLREGDGLKVLETLGLTDLLETSSKDRCVV